MLRAAVRGFDDRYATQNSDAPDRRVICRRRLPTHFVATGYFTGARFYTWMARTGGSTAGFTVSWGEPREEMGRMLSVLLAHAFLADPR